MNYILRPEVIEGFFYLWRITKKEIYKDWVWSAIQAINKYCRVENGFSGISDVYSLQPVCSSQVFLISSMISLETFLEIITTDLPLVQLGIDF